MSTDRIKMNKTNALNIHRRHIGVLMRRILEEECWSSGLPPELLIGDSWAKNSQFIAHQSFRQYYLGKSIPNTWWWKWGMGNWIMFFRGFFARAETPSRAASFPHNSLIFAPIHLFQFSKHWMKIRTLYSVVRLSFSIPSQVQTLSTFK